MTKSTQYALGVFGLIIVLFFVNRHAATLLIVRPLLIMKAYSSYSSLRRASRKRR